MNVTVPNRSRPPRLNPFAFPSDTTFRFVLLIVAVLGASLFIYYWLVGPLIIPHVQPAYSQCLGAVDTLHPVDNTIARTNPALYDEQRTARTNAGLACLELLELPHALSILACVALLLLIAGVIYWFAPRVKIWRDRLVPLSAEDAPEVASVLSELSRKAGLPYPVTFVWNPLNPAIDGVTFGHFGSYYIALSGGLVAQFYIDRPAFQAALLHELAHLRNADVDKTYFAVALWQAFVLVGLTPFAGSLIYNSIVDRDSVYFGLAWRILPLAALVYCILSAILRAREYYADVQASVWDGSTATLERMVSQLPRSRSRRWPSIIMMHPEPDQRHRALTDPLHLFGMGFWDAFGTGVTAAIAVPNLVQWLHLLLPSQPWVEATAVIGLLIAPLVVGVVGLGIWRGVFALSMRGKAPFRAGHLAFGLGLGMSLGQFVAFSGIATEVALPVGLVEATSWHSALIFFVVWGSVLSISLFGFLRWIASAASVWLEVTRTRRSLRLGMTLAFVVAGGVLAIWFGTLFAALQIGSEGAQVLLGIAGIALGLLVNTLGSSSTLLGCVALWAFPMAAWIRRARSATPTVPDWAFLDPAPQHFALLRQEPLRPRPALLTGVIGSIVFFGLLLAVRIWLRWGLSEVPRGPDQTNLLFAYGQVAIAVLLQAGAAVVVAGWVRRLGALHGLFAAFVAGCLMTAAMFGLNLAFGGTFDLGDAWLTFAFVVNGGALLALPLALAIAALAGWIRRLRRSIRGRRVADATLLEQLLAEAPSPALK